MERWEDRIETSGFFDPTISWLDKKCSETLKNIFLRYLSIIDDDHKQQIPKESSEFFKKIQPFSDEFDNPHSNLLKYIFEWPSSVNNIIYEIPEIFACFLYINDISKINKLVLSTFLLILQSNKDYQNTFFKYLLSLRKDELFYFKNIKWFIDNIYDLYKWNETILGTLEEHFWYQFIKKSK